MHLILCGLQGSGKTTIGKQLATCFEYAFIDTDALIETSYYLQEKVSLSCRDIYRQQGKSFFRDLEKKSVLDLAPSTPTVIATGGGTLEDRESLNHLITLGPLIYLETPLDILWNRVSSKQIPAHLNRQDPRAHFYALAERRIAIYEKAASIIINTASVTIEQITTEIHLWAAIHLDTSLKSQPGVNLTEKPLELSSTDAPRELPSVIKRLI